MIVAVCMVISAQAQTIQKGDTFWDGEVLFSATVKLSGDVFLSGEDMGGTHYEITLRKVGKKPGEYELTKSGIMQAPYGCKYGDRVRYFHRKDISFLAFYVDELTIGQTAIQTPDQLRECATRQRYAEEGDPLKLFRTWLMNQKYISTLELDYLESMINSLDKKQNKNIIENTNLMMIDYALASGMYGKHKAQGTGASVIDADTAIGDDETTVEIPSMPTDGVTVLSEREFLAALGSNRTINIAPGITLNLSKVLNQQENFTTFDRIWRNETYSERTGLTGLVASCACSDGRQLDLVNLRDLTIRGGKGSMIVVEPRYANVLNFYGCRNIRLENLVIGHTEEGYCQGGVIYCEGSEGINIVNCELYGCGTYGLQAFKTQGIVMEKTIIRDCSYGIMELHNSQYCSFVDCDFVRCRQYTLVSIDDGCKNTRFTRCRFAENKGTLFDIQSSIMVESCEIHHPEDQPLGNTDSPCFGYMGNETKWLRDNARLDDRKIGPSKP